MICSDCPPVAGELFSCWLYRQSMLSKTTSLVPEELSRLWRDLGQAGDFDPDFSHSSHFVNAACEVLGLSVGLKATLLQPPSSWLIPRFYRRTFCYQCLAENIRALSFPTGLKDWCTVTSTVCEFHNIPLLDAAEVFNPKLSMAMKFFQMYYLHHPRYRSASRFEDGLRCLNSLLNVQAMLNRFEVDAVSANPLQDTINNDKWRFSKFLVCLLLFPRFGLINRHIRNDASYRQLPLFHQAFAHGPLIASIAHRRASLLILGWLYEIIPSDETTVIEELLPEVGSVIGYFDAYGLGHSCNGFTAEHGGAIAQRLIHWQPSALPDRVLQFVEGFVASTRK